MDSIKELVDAFTEVLVDDQSPHVIWQDDGYVIAPDFLYYTEEFCRVTYPIIAVMQNRQGYLENVDASGGLSQIKDGQWVYEMDQKTLSKWNELLYRNSWNPREFEASTDVSLTFDFDDKYQVWAREILNPFLPIVLGRFDIGVKCNITFVDNKLIVEWIYEHGIQSSRNWPVLLPSVGGLFYDLYLNGKLTDFVINCGNSTFSVHKLIMYANGGDYFKTLIDSSFREAETNQVSLLVCSPPILSIYLDLVYSADELNITDIDTLIELYKFVSYVDHELFTIDIAHHIIYYATANDAEKLNTLAQYYPGIHDLIKTYLGDLGYM